MKRLFLIAACIISVFCFTGCQSAVQVNERMFVRLMGIRITEDGYDIAAQICSQESADSSASSKYSLVRGSGSSFDEAVDNINRENGRQLFFGHCTTIYTDEVLLTDSGALLQLAGKRISIGCPLIYSENPIYTVMSMGDGEENNADIVKGTLTDLYKNGQLAALTLKDSVINAQNSEITVLPCFDYEKGGSMVVFSDGRTALLSGSETKLYNLLNEQPMIKFYSSGSGIKINKPDTSIYYRKMDNGGELTVNIKGKYEIDDLININDEQELLNNAEGDIRNELVRFIERADEEKFLSALSDDIGADFSQVSVKIELMKKQG